MSGVVNGCTSLLRRVASARFHRLHRRARMGIRPIHRGEMTSAVGSDVQSAPTAARTSATNLVCNQFRHWTTCSRCSKLARRRVRLSRRSTLYRGARPRRVDALALPTAGLRWRAHAGFPRAERSRRRDRVDVVAPLVLESGASATATSPHHHPARAACSFLQNCPPCGQIGAMIGDTRVPRSESATAITVRFSVREVEVLASPRLRPATVIGIGSANGARWPPPRPPQPRPT